MALSFNDSVGVSYDADPSYFDGPDPTTVDLVGEAIDSAEAFGTFVIDQRVFGNGLASSEAFGTLLVTSRIQNLTGIPTAESVPTGAHAKHRILGQGFEDPSVVNNVQLNRRLYAVGIASSEAFGTAKLTLRLQNLSGIGSGEAFGTPQVNHQILGQGLASTEVFGNLVLSQRLYPSGIASQEVVPATRFSYPYDETPAPWSFDNDPGTFDGTEFWQAINFLGIASAEAFGTLEVKFGFSPVAIPSEEAFGTPRATLQVNAPASIPSLEAFGSPQINHQLLGQGFVDPSIFSVNGQVIHRLDIVGIPSEEAFGTQYLGYSYDGAPTPWSFDNEIITFDGPELWQVINFLGFISAEAFGTANITFPVYPAAINSLEAFGSVQLDQSLAFTGIESTEAFGGLQVDLPLFVSAIPGQEALGTPNVLQAVNGFAGISSAEAFGTPFLSQRLFIVGIASTEAFGTFEIRPVWESVDPVSSSWSGVSAQVTVWSEVSAIGLSWSALSPIASVWSPASSQTSAWGVASSQSTPWSALESAQASWVPDSSMSLTWTPVASVPKSWTSATPASTTWSKAA